MKSEFGRGYATCLRQFTFHGKRLDGMIRFYGEMAGRNPELFGENHAVEAWANGASDHLYELHRPRRGVPVAEWKAAKTLQDRALDIGHGFRASSKSNPDEARSLLDDATRLLNALAARGHNVTTLDDALETDRALGLSPSPGDWSCREDLEYRR